jgi:hypothetical protein
VTILNSVFRSDEIEIAKPEESEDNKEAALNSTGFDTETNWKITTLKTEKETEE